MVTRGSRLIVATLVIGTAFFAGCAKRPATTAASAPAPTGAAATTASTAGATQMAPAPAPAPPTAAPQAPATTARPSPKEFTAIPELKPIYFDFDKYDVRDEFRPLVEAHAKYLRENPAARMLIQGNADERGSREYNVALGQKRSDNVKKMLMLLGAREAQLESVSLGEEKPACGEHSEECWAKNRRGEMLYSGEY